MLYTFGNLLSLTSTMLLFGPMRQLKNMFHSKRIIATVCYLLSLAGTLGVAIGTKLVVPTLLMIGVQFVCLIW